MVQACPYYRYAQVAYAHAYRRIDMCIGTDVDMFMDMCIGMHTQQDLTLAVAEYRELTDVLAWLNKWYYTTSVIASQEFL